MDKSTKYCELKVFLKNGQRLTGMFHVSSRTSSAIRPSDAIMERHDGLLLLSDVTIFDKEVPRQVSAVMVPTDAIALIELPAGWVSRPDSMGESDPTNAARAAHSTPSISPASPLPTSRPATSKWLVGGGQPHKGS